MDVIENTDSGSIDKSSDFRRKIVSAFDHVLDGLSQEELYKVRRWHEIGSFCSTLVGVKPSSLTDQGLSQWLISKINQTDPEVSAEIDIVPVKGSFDPLLVNKNQIIQVFKRNPDYFPNVDTYKEARIFLENHFTANIADAELSSQEYINKLMIAGLILGFPKGDCLTFAQLNNRLFEQLLSKIKSDDSQDSDNLGINKAELDLLRTFYLTSTNRKEHSLISQNHKEAQLLQTQVQNILNHVRNVDSEVKDYFLKRRFMSVNDIHWIGTLHSPESQQFVSDIDRVFQESGLTNVLIEHDIVLQGHSNDIYREALPQAV